MSEKPNLQPLKEKLDVNDKDEKELKDALENYEKTQDNATFENLKKEFKELYDTTKKEDLKKELKKMEEEIAVVEEKKAKEQAAVTGETQDALKNEQNKIDPNLKFWDAVSSGDPKKVWEYITKGDHFFAKGIALFGGVLGIGKGAEAALVDNKDGKKGFFASLSEKFTSVMDSLKSAFGLGNKDKEKESGGKGTESNSDAEKYIALVNQIKEMAKGQGRKLDFKDPTPATSEVNETLERTSLMSTKILEVLKNVGEKFPGVRITSTVRSKEENGKLEGSAENSKHLYGFAFDVGRDLRTPALYSLEGVESHIKQIYPNYKTLIHGEGDNEHLHIETDESTDGLTAYADNQAIADALSVA